MNFDTFLHQLALGSPLFGLILAGYLIMRVAKWPRAMAEHMSTFVFSVALPAMLFRMMIDLSHLPPVDGRLLFAFFGSCLLVYLIGRFVSSRIFGLDSISQSVFGMGCIFSNNVMLGLPLARAYLGDQAIPSVALVLVFNSLILWTLISVSIEWAKHGSPSIKGFGNTLRVVLKNPLIIAIVSGAILGISGVQLPAVIDTPIEMVGHTGMPLALITLGMSLTEYHIRNEWRLSVGLATMKLLIQPFSVWGLCWLINLPPLETRVVVLLGSIGMGVNVFLMARQFKALEGAVAGALIISTVASAVTTPLIVALTA